MAELDTLFFRDAILSGSMLAREAELEQRKVQRARRVVAGAARDAADARVLLDMMGLLPGGEPTPTAGPGAHWGLRT